MVDNIEEAVDNLRKNDAKVINAIQQVGDDVYVAVIEDPFGNYVGLIQENFLKA